MKSQIVLRMLGEDMPVAAAPGAGQPAAPAGSAGAPDAQVSPGVESLLAMWQSGGHEAVALRVLDALDSYEDFVALLFKIGQEGANELGQIMDTLTAEEKSPHKYDQVPDDQIASKAGARPAAGSANGALGSTE